MKLLVLDIETYPNTVYTWGLFDQNVALNQIVEPGGILSFAAKWVGDKAVTFASVHDTTERGMLKEAHRLLSEADAVIGWNSAAFDIKWLQGQFMKHGMAPPEPFKQIDLLRTVRQQAKFASNKLDHVAQYLGIGSKAQTGGFELWKACMAGDDKAWRTMRKYNIQDVRLTEEVYLKLRPWVKNHPNISAYSGEECCPKCGGHKHQRRGTFETATRNYAKYQCVTRLPTGGVCGAWFRGMVAEPIRAKRVAVG